ncbi:MAG TPA: anti-sigma factor [Acidobacteriaceae bacterium]|nr:anti-sigma factor [Acidobacteriaceae bacterium]
MHPNTLRDGRCPDYLLMDGKTVKETDAGETTRRFQPGLWIGWILAAVFVCIAAWLAHHAAWLQRQLNLAEGNAARVQMRLDHANEVADVLTSPQARHVVLSEARGPARPGGDANWLESDGALVFVASGLKPLPAGKTYELWMEALQSEAPLPAGMFQPNPDGSAAVVLPPLPAHTQPRRFLVTVEPVSGSATPSLPIVMQGQ